MTTAAFYDGRRSGYYGAPASKNPYRKGWPSEHIAEADEWDKGFASGQFLRTAQANELLHSLDHLGKVLRCPK